MKRPLQVLALVGALLPLAGVNLMIAHQEKSFAAAESVFLELGASDPRSLMQGDYMALRFRLPPDIVRLISVRHQTRGTLVIQVGPDRVGKVVREYRGEELAPDERLLRIGKHRGELHTRGMSFFLQEGTAKEYAGAAYAEFKLAADGRCMIVGLRDRERRALPAAAD